MQTLVKMEKKDVAVIDIKSATLIEKTLTESGLLASITLRDETGKIFEIRNAIGYQNYFDVFIIQPKEKITIFRIVGTVGIFHAKFEAVFNDAESAEKFKEDIKQMDTSANLEIVKEEIDKPEPEVKNA